MIATGLRIAALSFLGAALLHCASGAGPYESCSDDASCASNLCPPALGYCVDLCELEDGTCSGEGVCSNSRYNPGSNRGVCTLPEDLPEPNDQCLNYLGTCTDTSECCDPGPQGATLSCIQYAGGNSSCTHTCSTHEDCANNTSYNCRCESLPSGTTSLGAMRGTGVCGGGISCTSDADCCGDKICVQASGGGGSYCQLPCTAGCGTTLCCTGSGTPVGGGSAVSYCAACNTGGGGSGGGGSGSGKCSSCLSSCSGLPGCCCGSGCMCDSECTDSCNDS